MDVSTGDLLIFTEAGDGAGTAVSAADGAAVTLTASTSLVIDARDKAVSATGGASVEIDSSSSFIWGDVTASEAGSVNVSTGSSSSLIGTLSAASGAAVNVSLGAASNYFGRTATDAASTVTLTLGEGSEWFCLGDSELTSLTAVNSTIAINAVSEEGSFTTLTVGTLSGSGITFEMSADLAAGQSDRLVITNSPAEGVSYAVSLNLIGSEPAGNVSGISLISGAADAAFSLTDQVAYNGSADSWTLEYMTEEEGVASAGWYLTRQSGTNAADTRETDTVKNFGTSAGAYYAWRADMREISARVAEIRGGVVSAAGLWVKGIHERDRVSTAPGKGLRQKTFGLHIGADSIVADRGNAAWLAGVSLRFAHSDQDHLASAGNGTGNLDQYSAKLWASRVGRSGAYTTVVLTGGFYDADFEGVSNARNLTVKSDYTTFGLGAALEAGHRFEFGDRSPWFVEPQLALSYLWVKGRDWTTTTGMQVSQEDAEFLTGRAGFELGRRFPVGLTENDPRSMQFSLRAGVIHEFMGDQDVTLNRSHRFASEIGGTTAYYGLGLDFGLSEAQNLSVSLERETGAHYHRDLSARVNWSWRF